MDNNTVELQVSGDHALFSDPITRVSGQKCSYPVPTYEALKGIVKNCYFKPTLIWFIDAVRVMNPIRMSTRGVRLIHYQNSGVDRSYQTRLDDVCYQIRAHFEWNLNRPEYAWDRDAEKHLDIAEKAIRKGGRVPVFLGVSECGAFVEECVFGSGEGYYDNAGDRSFGVMVHGITYADEAYSEATKGMMTLNMWEPVMHNGVIEFIRPDACTMTKPIRPMGIKKFCRPAKYGVISAGKVVL